MENNESLFELQIDQPIMNHLYETAKWAKFLAIVGFIFCGLFLIIGVFGGSFVATSFRTTESAAYNAGYTSMIFIIYAVFALIYFFPCLFLFHFAQNMRTALRSTDQTLLTDSFKNLKKCYRFMGILAIIVISFWVLALFLGILGGTLMR